MYVKRDPFVQTDTTIHIATVLVSSPDRTLKRREKESGDFGQFSWFGQSVGMCVDTGAFVQSLDLIGQQGCIGDQI